MPFKYAEIAGVPIHYVHGGASTLPDVVPPFAPERTVLLVHGEGGNANLWHSQLTAVSADYHALALDFPGHGRSGGTESLKTIGAYSDLLAQLISTLGLPPLVVVGHSMGAAAAMQLAVSHPDRVRALVLVGCPARFSTEQLDTWRNVMLGRAPQPFTMEHFSPKAEPPVIRATFMEQVKTDPRVRYFDMVACNEFDAASVAPSIPQPTLLIAGRDDSLAPLAAVESLQRAIAGSRLEVIEDGGHSLTMEKPDAVTALIRDFVAELSR